MGKQAFTPAAIASYTPAVTGVISSTLEEWAGAGSFKAWAGCRQLAFDVAAMVLLGRQMDAETIRTFFSPPPPLVLLHLAAKCLLISPPLFSLLSFFSQRACACVHHVHCQAIDRRCVGSKPGSIYSVSSIGQCNWSIRCVALDRARRPA